MAYHFCPNCGTKLQKRFVKEQERLYCPLCQKFVYRNPMAAVAGIILNDKGEILMGRRSWNQTYPGKWCIPCGHIEWNEDIRDALVREMREETGLDVAPIRIYSVHSNFHEPEALSVGCWFLCKVLSGVAQAADDVDRVAYFSYDNLPELAFPTDSYVLRELHDEGLLV